MEIFTDVRQKMRPEGEGPGAVCGTRDSLRQTLFQSVCCQQVCGCACYGRLHHENVNNSLTLLEDARPVRISKSDVAWNIFSPEAPHPQRKVQVQFAFMNCPRLWQTNVVSEEHLELLAGKSQIPRQGVTLNG